MKKIIVIIFLLMILDVFTYSKDQKDEKVYMKIVKGPDPTILGLRYTYSKTQLPIRVDECAWAFGPRYWKGKFYYYKDNKYVGYNTNDYDTVFMESYSVNKIFKYNDNNKLILMSEFWITDNSDMEHINFNSIKLDPLGDNVSRFNKNGYPDSLYSEKTGYMTFFKFFEESKCNYEYSDAKTYDGKLQINKMFARNDVYSFKYDKYGRIIKISMPDTLIGGGEYLALYYIYKKNVLYVIRRWVSTTVKNDKDVRGKNILELYYRYFNKYGYLENRNEFGVEFDRERYKELYDNFNNETKLLQSLNNVLDQKIRHIIYKDYRYKKVDPKYKDNLKIQEGLIDYYDSREYYLGIIPWYRYKYMHDLTTDD